ncbi:hypothetical protein RRG08_032123 [Elysia crispata]|uniref:Uncharacterized protein n=1 Tax=Elysia crispata TaxID=231223 RepID=A0AAE0ZDU3_9GAST|nr:hypothetical protein RRG08_032123 [Elysia crispata]
MRSHGPQFDMMDKLRALVYMLLFELACKTYGKVLGLTKNSRSLPGIKDKDGEAYWERQYSSLPIVKLISKLSLCGNRSEFKQRPCLVTPSLPTLPTYSLGYSQCFYP